MYDEEGAGEWVGVSGGLDAVGGVCGAGLGVVAIFFGWGGFWLGPAFFFPFLSVGFVRLSVGGMRTRIGFVDLSREQSKLERRYGLIASGTRRN